MCITCGCGQDATRVDGVPVPGSATGDEREHLHAAGTIYTHHPAHAGGFPHPMGGSDALHQHADGTWHSHVHGGASAHSSALGAARLPSESALGAVHDHAMPGERIVSIEQDILARNNAHAAENRQTFADRGIFALNLVSSPGSGKTSLLVRTIQALQGRVPVHVIEGDQQTSLDADRIRATGAAAVQLNTGKGCHLDAHMVGHALARLDPAQGSLLMIENVGNLVCPAAFDLGEAHKVVILSVTEGEDKPLKYPDIFRAADLMLVNKIDLKPHVQFDVANAIAYARRMRPALEVIEVSATTGEGFVAWLAWLERGIAAAKDARGESIAGLRRRVAELEAQVAAADRPT